MLVAIDVGNTQTVVGLYAKDSYELFDHWRMSTQHGKTSDEYGLAISQFLFSKGFTANDVHGVIICSGVPIVTSALRLMCARLYDLDALVVGPGVKSGVPLRLDNPKEAGADRIANAVAVVDKYNEQAIVVDFGTATTFDVISSNGEYLGGAITPGLRISLDALVSRAAALGRIELVAPNRVVGRSTSTAMQSGVLFGYASLVDGMCKKIKNEVGDAKVIATGGLGAFVAPHSEEITIVDPWLTLHGLRVIWDKNQ